MRRVPAFSNVNSTNEFAFPVRIFDFCIPKGTSVPSGPNWPHEIKYDGHRLRLERDGERVRLITRGAYNLDRPHGEAVVLGVDGVSDFNALHSRKDELRAMRHAIQMTLAMSSCFSMRAGPNRLRSYRLRTVKQLTRQPARVS
jgi:ATP-dependent DNA ligase